MNLSQRLQDLARPAGRIVLSGATYDALAEPPSDAVALEDLHVKGREGEVRAFWIEVAGTNPEGQGGTG